MFRLAAGLAERDLDLEAAGEALTLRLFGEGERFLGEGERERGERERRRIGLRLSRNGDLRPGDLRPGDLLRGGERLGNLGGDLLRGGDLRPYPPLGGERRRKGGGPPLRLGEGPLRGGLGLFGLCGRVKRTESTLPSIWPPSIDSFAFSACSWFSNST